jgi:hypothetical protein
MDISLRMGRRMFAAAVLDTTSVMVAVNRLTIMLISQTGKRRR